MAAKWGDGALFIGAAVLVPSVLVLDAPSLSRQLTLGGVTAASLVAGAMFTRTAWLPVLLAVLIAGTGEVILSVAWGLYDYRNAVIPLYVFPGHGVFYLLALRASRIAVLQRNVRGLLAGVMAGGSLIAVAQLLLLDDVWGFLWWCGAAALIVGSRSPLLLAICFVITYALEVLGTSLGNWQWSPVVPGLRIPSANPPSGVGILYVLLDLLTVGVGGAVAARLSGGDDEAGPSQVEAPPV